MEETIGEEDAWIAKLDHATGESVRTIASKALHEIEVIRGDSKLSALGTLLDHLKEKRTPVQRICVLTHFRATLFYLSAEIEGRGNDYCLLHGEMHALGREQSLDSFLSRETILVATTAMNQHRSWEQFGNIHCRIPYNSVPSEAGK